LDTTDVLPRSRSAKVIDLFTMIQRLNSYQLVFSHHFGATMAFVHSSAITSKTAEVTHYLAVTHILSSDVVFISNICPETVNFVASQ
jgi:hypothetical protein